MHIEEKSLHIVEPGGQGGVYQHVLGAMQNRQFIDYEKVTLHTARDAEIQPDIPGLEFCLCMRYQRSGKRPLRATISLGWVAFVLIPHLFFTAARSRDDWEIQGLFGKGIYAFLVGMPRLFRRNVTFVPHNSFSRSDNKLEALSRKFATKWASKTVVFVRSEKDKFPYAGTIVLRRLWQYVTVEDARRNEKWADLVRSEHRPVVLFVGQLRKDKNPLLLMGAVNLVPDPLTLVFAGENKGAVDEIRAFNLAPRHRLIVEERYLDIEDFQAIIRSSDLLACPYKIASQSGVISLAVQLGKPVVASNVGGLSEQTPHTYDASAPQPEINLSAVIISVLNEHIRSS